MATKTVTVTIHESGSAENPTTTAIALNNTVVAQQPSMLSDLVYANHVVSNNLGAESQIGNQDALNRLRQMIVADAVMRVQDTGPMTARAAVTTLTSNAVAQEIADLKAAIKAFSTRP